jgi:hypothetical protein
VGENRVAGGGTHLLVIAADHNHEASYTSSLRPHTVVAEGLMH